jgi:hypothetical protein
VPACAPPLLAATGSAPWLVGALSAARCACSRSPGALALLSRRGKARSTALISATQLRQSGPWAARQHYNAAKLLVRVVCAAAQLRAPARAPQSPPIAISGCKKPLAKSAQV